LNRTELTTFLVYVARQSKRKEGILERADSDLYRMLRGKQNLEERLEATRQAEEERKRRVEEFDHKQRFYSFAVVNSTANQISAALKKCPPDLFHVTRQERKITRTGRIKRMIEFAMDCPLENEIHLPGLVDKSIEYHDHQIEVEAEKEREWARGVTLPVLKEEPPDPRVKYVGGSGEKYIELGNELHNCLARYVGDAIYGGFVLFEITFEGERAAIQVDCDLKRIIQAQGPNNKPNKASAFGARYLKKWAPEHLAIAEKGQIANGGIREGPTHAGRIRL